MCLCWGSCSLYVELAFYGHFVFISRALHVLLMIYRWFLSCPYAQRPSPDSGINSKDHPKIWFDFHHTFVYCNYDFFKLLWIWSRHVNKNLFQRCASKDHSWKVSWELLLWVSLGNSSQVCLREVFSTTLLLHPAAIISHVPFQACLMLNFS